MGRITASRVTNFMSWLKEFKENSKKQTKKDDRHDRRWEKKRDRNVRS